MVVRRQPFRLCRRVSQTETQPSPKPEDYESWREGRLGAVTQARELELVFRLGGDLSGRRLLDAGCGDGLYLVEAARRGARASGVDISEAMLTVARRRAEDAEVDVDLRKGDVTALPFQDETFDVVFLVTVLCFVGDAPGAVTEAARVLRPGGRLVVGELGRWSLWAGWRRLRGWLGNETWRHGTFRSARQLTALIERAGLTVQARRGAIYYPPVAAAAPPVAECAQRPDTGVTCGAAFVAISASKPAD